uniref:Glycosyltransferase n=1 Tax=viral metagenome TaxID=1070528 RepID=A0A6C0B9X1_9ZZZZ
MNFLLRSTQVNRKNNTFSQTINLEKRLQQKYPIKHVYNSIIPLKIFQTWHTKDLPPDMKKAVEFVKSSNPAFEHQLFDDNDCRKYIENNFPEIVVQAFDRLIPGAYKADLWRYCVLYKEGGIYMDIKYIPHNGFRLIHLTEKEHFVLDQDNYGIYNALMVCKPGNPILSKAIRQVIRNIKMKYYGNTELHPTGPRLLGQFFSQFVKNNLDMKHENHDNKYITFNNIIVLKMYSNYYDEMRKYQKNSHYDVLWNERKIYA